MSKVLIEEGSIIEGNKCSIVARRVEWKGLKIDPITQKRMMLYELDRNCSVEVLESLNLSEEELIIRRDLCVHGEVGDLIKGDAIQVWVDIKRNSLKFDVKEGISARHGASLADTPKRTVGRIKYSFPVYKKLLNHSSKASVESNIKGYLK